MPETTFLSYGHPQVGPELQPPSATLGSVGHEVGNCKPCALVYTKGCQSGAPVPQKVRGDESLKSASEMAEMSTLQHSSICLLHLGSCHELHSAEF